MGLSAFRCPNCHAALDVAEGATRVSCPYCETASQVRRRTRFLELPQRSAQVANLPVALQRHSKRWTVMLLATVFAMVGVTAITGFVLSRAKSSETQALPDAVTSSRASSALASAEAVKQNPWRPLIPGRPVLVDINGDKIPDIISRQRNVSEGDVVAVGAISGKDGKLMWRSEPLGTYNQLYHGGVSVHEKRIFLADTSGALHLIALKSGKLLGSVELSEKLENICVSGSSAWAMTADKKWHSVDAESETGEQEPADCLPLASDAGSMSSPLEPHRRFVRKEMEGMRVRYAQILLDGSVLVVGTKFPGTAVPMMARYRAEIDPMTERHPSVPKAPNAVRLSRLMKKQRAELEALQEKLNSAEVFWTVDMPQGEVLSAKLPGHQLVSANDEVVAAVYDGANSHSFLVVLDIKSGTARFEEDLGERAGVRSVLARGDAIYLSSWDGLKVYDAKDASLRLAVGR